MNKIFMILIIILLTGCATTNHELKQVYITVPVKCNDKPIPNKPELFSDKMKGDEKINEIINGYQTDINKLEVYADELKVLICK